MRFSLLSACCVSFLLAPLLRRLALAWDITDHPETRKLQKTPVPLLGGAAVYLGIVVGGWPYFFTDPLMAGLFFGATLIFIVCLIDDALELSARVRLLAQFCAASLLVMNGAKITFLGPGPFLNVIEIIVTFIWILGITNALNYLDGVDGLCAGIAVISSLFFAVVLRAGEQHLVMAIALVTMGACAGFLPHNLKRKKMFLGDAGSMLIGFLLAGVSLIGHWASNDIIKVTVPVLIMGVPIFDMTFTTIMRIAEKKIHNVVEWLEYAGRDHFHHYLMDLGLRPGGAVLFIYAVSISMGLSALVIADSDRPMTALLTLSKSAITFGVIAVLMVLGRRLHKQKEVKERLGI